MRLNASDLAISQGEQLGEAIGDHGWASPAFRLLTKIGDNDVTSSPEALGSNLVVVRLGSATSGNSAHEALWSLRRASETREGNELDIVREIGVFEPGSTELADLVRLVGGVSGRT